MQAAYSNHKICGETFFQIIGLAGFSAQRVASTHCARKGAYAHVKAVA
jgi:hypothetical protein